MDFTSHLSPTLIIVVLFHLLSICDTIDFVYHNYTALTNFLEETANKYPDITHLYSIGKSVQGRELWVLALGESPREHVTLRPEVKYLGNMHGNEVISRELLLHLIHHMVTQYNQEERITQLLRSVRIHILASVNPDGFEKALRDNQLGMCLGTIGRYNSNNVDLNRNFPDHFDSNNVRRQPETAAIMYWLNQHQFVLSGSLHGGALVANYPYDNYKNGGIRGFMGILKKEPRETLTRDNDIFTHLANTYSQTHPTMHQGQPCPFDYRGFSEGIVNGASWYAVKGSMQDYNYIYTGCMEITLEISCCKFPSTGQLQGFWLDNRQALIHFLEQVHRGVKGVVSDISGNPIDGATIQITGRDHPTITTDHGEYWRLLMPGTYLLNVSASGFMDSIETFTVIEGGPTVLNITVKTLHDLFSTDNFPSPTTQQTFTRTTTVVPSDQSCYPSSGAQSTVTKFQLSVLWGCCVILILSGLQVDLCRGIWQNKEHLFSTT